MRGVYVAVWANRHVLVIRNSYRSGYTLPGGGIKKNETPVDAAVRELREEVGVHCTPPELVPAGEIRADEQTVSDTDMAYIYDLWLADVPEIRVDNREVIWGGFVEPHAVQTLDMDHQLIRHIRRRWNEKNAGGK